MDISNWATLAGIIIAVATHLLVVSSKISKFMGVTEESFRSLRDKMETVSGICANCYLKARVEKVERRQDELREELPERLTNIERDIRGIKETLQQDRTGRKDRTTDR